MAFSERYNKLLIKFKDVVAFLNCPTKCANIWLHHARISSECSKTIQNKSHRVTKNK